MAMLNNQRVGFKFFILNHHLMTRRIWGTPHDFGKLHVRLSHSSSKWILTIRNATGTCDRFEELLLPLLGAEKLVTPWQPGSKKDFTGSFPWQTIR